MSTKEKLLAEVEEFLERHDMAATEFGERSCRDRHFVRRLRQGLGFTVDRFDEVRAFMSDFKPTQRTRKRPRGNAPAVAA